MNNSNLDDNTMKNIKNMVDNGNISEAISQISPEMIQNFQKMFQESSKSSSSSSPNENASATSNNSEKSTSHSDNFDISKIDMNMMMKISSLLNNMNSKNDPRSNLIYSLKPYLRDSKKEKIDQYANLLNLTKIAELFKDTNSGQKSND